MKVEITEQKQEDYPKLMISDNKSIVLFYQEREGTLLKSSGGSIIKEGDHFKAWNMEFFKPFEGEVKLSN